MFVETSGCMYAETVGARGAGCVRQFALVRGAVELALLFILIFILPVKKVFHHADVVP